MNPNIADKPFLYDTSFFNINSVTKIPGFVYGWLQGFHYSWIIYVASYALTFFGITIAIYCIVRLVELQNEEYSHLEHAIHETAMRLQSEDGNRNPRWEHIQELINSPNESDWRLSVIEADTVLENLLEDKNFIGNGIGEKLKNSGPGNLTSLQAAWDAHLVRNKIAHEGSDYEITQRDARKAIQQFEVVFRELGFL